MSARTWRSKAGFETGHAVRWSEGAEESLNRIMRNIAPEWRRLLTEPGALPAGAFKAGWRKAIWKAFSVKSGSRPTIRRHPAIPSFTPQHAIELIDESEAVLVDVRTARDFQRSRIRGAAHIPATELHSLLPRLIPDTGRLLIFVDESGDRSLDAAAEAANLGYHRAGFLHGGIKLWKTEGFPALTGDGKVIWRGPEFNKTW